MILTCHLLVGAAIASKIQLIPLALILAFFSHYFLDFLPQKEYSVKNIVAKRWYKSLGDFSKAFLDIALGILLIVFFSKGTLVIFVGALLAILPDASTLLAVIFHKNTLLKKHWILHSKINFFGENKKIPVFWKIFVQILVIFIAIFFLLQ